MANTVTESLLRRIIREELAELASTGMYSEEEEIDWLPRGRDIPFGHEDDFDDSVPLRGT